MAAKGKVLLLIDYINLFDFDGGDALAARAVLAARNAARLKADMKRRGCACIYVNDNFGHWDTDFSTLIRTCKRQGGASAKIATILRPKRGDHFVLKPRHSGFYGTPLEFLLQELNAATLVMAGVTVDTCVALTAQDAHMRKFAVQIPSNCSAGFTEHQETAAFDMLERTMHADTRPVGRVNRPKKQSKRRSV